MEQAPWAGLPLPLPGPASASLPPIPKHNHCQGISFHRGETHPAPGAPATGQRAAATGCTPRGLSPGLSSTFRGKVRQSSQMQSEATTENSGRDQTQCRKTGFKYRGAPAGRPPNSQYLSHLPGLLLDLCTRPSYLLPHTPSCWGGQERASGCCSRRDAAQPFFPRKALIGLSSI